MNETCGNWHSYIGIWAEFTGNGGYVGMLELVVAIVLENFESVHTLFKHPNTFLSIAQHSTRLVELIAQYSTRLVELQSRLLKANILLSIE